jgi:hypothetical protein
MLKKLKISEKRIKHSCVLNSEIMYPDYILKIGTVDLRFGNYKVDKRWRSSQDDFMFGIDREKSFKTMYQCKKYMLKQIANWINKNVDLSFNTDPAVKIRHPWIHS